VLASIDPSRMLRFIMLGAQIIPALRNRRRNNPTPPQKPINLFNSTMILLDLFKALIID
jgi:hypothetical protein